MEFAFVRAGRHTNQTPLSVNRVGLCAFDGSVELLLGGSWGETEFVHDFIFRRFQLTWAAIFDSKNIPACSVGRGTRCCV